MADDKKDSKPVSYPRGMKNEESAEKIESLMFKGMVFDDHERISSDEYWSQVCDSCVDEMPRLVNGVHELPEDCKGSIFKCGVQDCSQPATYFVDLPYEEMCPETVESPEPRRTVEIEAQINEVLKPHGLKVIKK